MTRNYSLSVLGIHYKYVAFLEMVDLKARGRRTCECALEFCKYRGN